ncbi:MAG: AraC family transcriptional regulator, partial [Eubacterium sp.]
MHAWEQIQTTVDYIEDHLAETLKIEALAQMAALSPFYYQRLFKRLVKKTVMEYIKLRRLALATEALLQKDKRIVDVALELGFSSHEQFTKDFKDTFGMTPES